MLGAIALLTLAAVVGVKMWRNRQVQEQGPGAPGAPGVPGNAGELPGASDGDPARPGFCELGTAAFGGPNVTAIAWRPDGGQIAAGRADGSVSIWDWASGAHALTGPGESEQAVDSLSWSPDGRLLATAHRRDHMTVWDVASAADVTAVWEVDGGDIYAVVGWGEDGRSVKTYNGEEYYALWNVDTRKCERSWFVSIAEQGEVVSPDGELAAWESMAEGRWTVHRTDRQLEWELLGHHGPIHGVSWKADSSQLAGATEGGVAVWTASTGQLVRSMSIAGKEVTYVSWSPDPGGRWILAGFDAGTPVVIDAHTGERMAEVPARGRSSSAWAPRGDRLATIGTDNVVHMYGEP